MSRATLAADVVVTTTVGAEGGVRSMSVVTICERNLDSQTPCRGARTHDCARCARTSGVENSPTPTLFTHATDTASWVPDRIGSLAYRDSTRDSPATLCSSVVLVSTWKASQHHTVGENHLRALTRHTTAVLPYQSSHHQCLLNDVSDKGNTTHVEWL